NEKGAQTFSNQALNTLFNYSTRPLLPLTVSWYLKITNKTECVGSTVFAGDARADVLTQDVFWEPEMSSCSATNGASGSRLRIPLMWSWDVRLCQRTIRNFGCGYGTRCRPRPRAST